VLERVHGLIVRLHVTVGQRAGPIDLGQPLLGLVEEAVVIGRIQRALEDRDVAVDGDEAVDLVAERRQIDGLADGAVTGPFLYFLVRPRS